MKVLVLGGGQIATAVVKAAASGINVIARARAQLDIADPVAVARTFAELKPNWVVNAAAYTAVDLAEDNRNQAKAVNDTAVASLAKAAAGAESRLLHLSTDFVFDGTSSRAYLPNDATNPLSVYGATKLAGERHVLADKNGIVLRTSWVHASAGKNFVLTMLKLMKEREQLKVVSDQIGSPTWAASVAAAIWGLITAARQGGLYHWTDLGVASWYDFAIAIQEEARLLNLLSRSIPIVPISSAEYPTRARRPAFSVLNSESTRAATGLAGHHWRENLRRMLDELRAA
ncbi:MAG: dTDP-4-dehydrorhamnose reductase [Pseudomonadota bacterium]|nr:dTDP-4-dehydrorhamnose reductase [Pseudomonadota bacterium]